MHIVILYIYFVVTQMVRVIRNSFLHYPSPITTILSTQDFCIALYLLHCLISTCCCRHNNSDDLSYNNIIYIAAQTNTYRLLLIPTRARITSFALYASSGYVRVSFPSLVNQT